MHARGDQLPAHRVVVSFEFLDVSLPVVPAIPRCWQAGVRSARFVHERLRGDFKGVVLGAPVCHLVPKGHRTPPNDTERLRMAPNAARMDPNGFKRHRKILRRQLYTISPFWDLSGEKTSETIDNSSVEAGATRIELTVSARPPPPAAVASDYADSRERLFVQREPGLFWSCLSRLGGTLQNHMRI